MNYFEQEIQNSFKNELCKIAQYERRGASFGQVAKGVAVGAVAAPTIGSGIVGAIKGARKGGLAGAAAGFASGFVRPAKSIYHGVKAARGVSVLQHGGGSKTQAVKDLWGALKSGTVVSPKEFIKNVNIFNPATYKQELKRQVMQNVGKPIAAVGGGAVLGGAGTWALNR